MVEVPRTQRSVDSLGKWAVLSFVAYMLVPALLWRFVLRRKLRDLGLSFKGFFRHLPLYSVLYLGVLPVVWWASTQPEFLGTYPFTLDVRANAGEFLLWELYYGLQFLALEFFFRGFMVFGLEHRFGANAILVMIVPYCMLHFHKPMLEAIAAVGAGLILGTLAYRTRCVLGGVLIHWAVAVTMDLLAVRGHGGFL